MKPSNDSIVLLGGAVKAKGEGKVGGYLVLFGSEEEKDLSGEFFTKSTDFDTDFPGRATPYYHHGLDPEVGVRKLSETKAEIGVDDVGVWIDAQLNMRDKYAAAVYKMADEEKLGWSSGTAPHLVETKESGEILHWPLGLDASLTPTPCDSRNLVSTKSCIRPLKSLAPPTLAQLTGRKSNGLSQSDKRRILGAALDKKLEANGLYLYSYVEDVFDASLVYRVGDRSYEAPYTLSGFVATIGDGVEVAEITRYEPVSPAPIDPEAGLKSARGLIERLRSGTATDAALAEIKGLHAEIAAYLTPPVDHRAAFDREAFHALCHPAF